MSLANNAASVVTAFHRNQHLFSDYYLNRKLPALNEWGGVATDAETARAQIRDLLGKYVPSNNESQLENDLIRPVLALLRRPDVPRHL